MNKNIEFHRIYTTAPENMDIHGTRVLDVKAGITSSGRNIRLVAIPEEQYSKQMKFYITNLHSVMDEREWKTEQQFGNVKPSQPRPAL